MTSALLKPYPDLAALILRLALASIMIVHGGIKIMQSRPLIPDSMSLAQQMVVGWAELIIGLVLALGLFTRLAALGAIAIQVCAIVLVTGEFAFRVLVIKSAGADFTQVGPEYNFVLIATALGIIALSAGQYSVDHWLWSRWASRTPGTTPAPAVPVDQPA